MATGGKRFSGKKAPRKTTPAMRGVVKDTSVAKKPRRLGKGYRAARRMTKMQRSTRLLIRKAPFKDFMKEILDEESGGGMSITAGALLAMQTAVEHRSTERQRAAVYLLQFVDRSTLYPKHLELVTHLRRQSHV